MNIEENRLDTFTNWPSDAVVSSVRIAKAGFYYLGERFVVKCFCCSLEISEWNYGDQVMAKHRELSPNCAFVLDSSTAGNVPNLGLTTFASMSSEDATDAQSNSLTNEAVRLQTFENWPVCDIVTPESLAKAGFYYLKKRDKTKCPFCNGVIVAWEVGDNPDYEHKRHFPNCSFVQQVIIPRLECNEEIQGPGPELSNVNIMSQLHLNELGINKHKGPKNSKYATFESRLRSFAMWPQNVQQTPESLADAGFYYEGCRDQVRCFHCDGGLRHWHPVDNPWIEHALWFPDCGFLLLVKGPTFIQNIYRDGYHCKNKDEESSNRAVSHQRRVVTDSEINAQMLTSQVISALSIGIHAGRIKVAIKQKLEQTGVGFSSADAVIEAALNLQLDEEDITDPNLTEVVNQQLLRMALSRVENHAEEVTPKEDQSTTNSSVKDDKNILKSSKSLSLEEENRLLKEARLCKICMDNEVGIVFLPCGHLTTCYNCAPNLEDCPVCRSTIKATVRTFLS